MRRAEALTKLRELLPEVRGRYGVKDLSLFGSIARDEANERQRHRCAGRLQWATNAAWIHGPQAVSSGCSRNTRRSRDPRSPQATNATTHRGGRRIGSPFEWNRSPLRAFTSTCHLARLFVDRNALGRLPSSGSIMTPTVWPTRTSARRPSCWCSTLCASCTGATRRAIPTAGRGTCRSLLGAGVETDPFDCEAALSCETRARGPFRRSLADPRWRAAGLRACESVAGRFHHRSVHLSETASSIPLTGTLRPPSAWSGSPRCRERRRSFRRSW